jgi:colanic acid biosynthesis glycosyl transferase WcaI
MRIQLWSYNFAPEAIGIGPVSATWAHAMAARGHAVEVVAAHPHYPTAEWGVRMTPYREQHDGIPVLRLPLWVGHDSVKARLRNEASFAVAQTVAVPFVGRPDVLVSVSPSFPALAPAIFNVRARRIPWVLWLQDLLPDAAVNTGLLGPGLILQAARALERTAYRTAGRIVLISERHREALRGHGVPATNLSVISNPMTLDAAPRPLASEHFTAPRVLSIGNIGLSQGLVELTRVFEASDELARRGVTLHFAGDGVQADALRAEIRGDRTKVLGIIPETIEAELARATVGLVGQRPETGEFNMPSRLMNFMGHGIPVIVVVSPASEVARLVRTSGGGWLVDASRPEEFLRVLCDVLDDPADVAARGRAAWAFAAREFTREGTAAAFERVLEEAISETPARPRRGCRSAGRASATFDA